MIWGSNEDHLDNSSTVATGGRTIFPLSLQEMNLYAVAMIIIASLLFVRLRRFRDGIKSMPSFHILSPRVRGVGSARSSSSSSSSSSSKIPFAGRHHHDASIASLPPPICCTSTLPSTVSSVCSSSSISTNCFENRSMNGSKVLHDRSVHRNESLSAEDAAMRRKMYYRALPKALNLNLSHFRDQQESIFAIQSILRNCSEEGLTYVEIEISIDGMDFGTFLEMVGSTLHEFERFERDRVDEERDRFYSMDGYASEPDGILFKYRLPLVPRLIVDLSRFSVGDANNILHYISDPISFRWNHYIVGISLNGIMMNQGFMSKFERVSQLAKEYGSKCQIRALPNCNNFLRFEVDRVEALVSCVNKGVPTSFNLANVSRTFNPEFLKCYSAGNPIVFSSTVGPTYSIRVTDQLISLSDLYALSDGDVAHMLTNNFHNVFENSRKTRAELTKSVTLRSRKLVKWAATNRKVISNDFNV